MEKEFEEILKEKIEDLRLFVKGKNGMNDPIIFITDMKNQNSNTPNETEIKKSDLKDYGEQGGAYTKCPNCEAMEIGNLAYEYCDYCSSCGTKFKWV